MIAYLSSEWIEEANRLLAAAPDLAIEAGGAPLVIQQTVQAPEADHLYHLVFDTDGARAVAGRADRADVEFRLPYDTAVAVARGQLSAQAAFQSGALRIAGTMQRLLAHREAVTACDDVLAPLRADTSYGAVDA
ncbi:MAG: SCP2 sterol-binding domain-containing protein [Acidimicrobiia bacterium]|nr:SCP2 sterol-binding domain-containing protein [Acidimicrobiia bacterium]MDH5236441.1 SCP2 sterol-binding domain-containing protein [Acidimicrobiia bacterium]